ncbi:MAG: site-2 protease family protein [Rhodospirillales bacterium]|nr:site-2 protease family protein [Rhodospirillales bacterium]
MHEVLYQISVLVIPVLLAITLHEAAHGWVASKLGDDTALRLGRVTFNPLRHIDPFGTIVLPAMLLLASNGQAMFGFAKPVPVDFRRLHHPRRDMVLVAGAGPGINLAMALIAAVFIRFMPVDPSALELWWYANLFNAVGMNILLAVFNMLPLPPLDGGRVAVGILPDPAARALARVEPYGFFIILAVVFVLPWLGRTLDFNFPVMQWLVVEPADWLSRVIFALVGVS